MRHTLIVSTALLLALPALAEESTLKQGAKKVGQETGQVVHKIGEGGKQFGKEVAKVAVEVGHATRDGAKEFAKTVKGEGETHKKTAPAKDAPPAHRHKGY